MALLKSAHGGNIREAAALMGISAEQLLDFSANINPLGMPESLKRAILNNMDCAERYPDVEYQQLHLALAEHHHIPASSILAGNGETEAIFTLVQGLNRQIRRMCEYFGYEVTKLERTRIMNVSLTGIPLGEWRDLTDDELIDLFKLIENSSSEAKPKAKAKPKTAGIKRPVVAMEKTSEKSSRPASNGKRFTAPGRKKKGR